MNTTQSARPAYQPTPRKIELQCRFEEVRAALPVPVINGHEFQGHEGLCVRVVVRKDDRSNVVAHRVSLDEITRQGGRTTVRTSRAIETPAREIYMRDEPNRIGGLGAGCTMPDPAAVIAAARELLAQPALSQPFTL